jgi:probable rRNA maturation factor
MDARLGSLERTRRSWNTPGMKRTGNRPRVLVKRVRAGDAPDSRTIARRAAKLLALLDMADAELSIVLCDDPFIRELNRDYRGKDRATDVLSFEQDGGSRADGGVRMLGDVVISTQTAARQAKARRCSLLDETTSLLAHGVLHLLGWDHETPADAHAMAERAEALEQAISRRSDRRA